MVISPSAYFTSFLDKHHARISYLDERDVSLDQIAAMAGLSNPSLPAFRAYDDTLLYIQLLKDLLHMVRPADAKVLVDLGAGSSLPTIAALRAVPEHKGLRISAVDNDPIAIECSRQNVRAAHLENRYTLVCKDLIQYLSKADIDATTLVAANVPYMPVPADEKDPFYIPVDGGVNGTHYLIPFLKTDFPEGMLLAVRWCSLSNPRKLIGIMNKFYEVVRITAQRAPFGTYALKLEDHLLKKRERGDAVFTTDDRGEHEFTFVSSILRRVR